MTQTDLFLIITLIVLSVGLAVWYLSKKLEIVSKKNEDQALIEWLKSTQGDLKKLQSILANSLEKSNKNVTDTLLKTSDSLNRRMDKAAEVIGALQKEAGQFSTISESMRDLHAFLKSPKLRGNIGEQVLSDLISQIFPKHSFHLQYTFKSGQKVDAAIKTDAGILPIDSKFPMEHFQKMIGESTRELRESAKKEFKKDVKKHIEDISKKYILPEEETLDFALMYIPSETVYYEIVGDTDLTEFARVKRVYPVSPTTLYAHLQMILLSYEGKKIEAKSREIFRLLRAIQKDYEKVESHLTTLGSHIGNAYNKFAEVSTSFTRLGQKLTTSDSLKLGGKDQLKLQ
jgi:DNA recombination protein RmuC